MVNLKNKFFYLSLLSLVLVGCSNQTAVEESPAEMQEEATEAVEDVEGGEVEEITAEVSIVVDGEEQEDLNQSLQVKQDTILLEAMDEAYDLEGEDGFITAIEGHEQDPDNNKYWLYSVNGEDAPVGAGEYEIQDNDQIEWRLESVDY